MMKFGKRIGGGRRADDRITAPLMAVLTTRAKRHVAELVDISATGARLRGNDLPPHGDEVILAVDRVRVFSIVCWHDAGDCGLQFDEPLSQDALADVRREVAEAAGIPVVMRAALEDWVSGTAR